MNNFVFLSPSYYPRKVIDVDIRRNIEASKSHVSKKKIHFSVYNLGIEKLESAG
jgi:hypothetical protein